MDMWVWLYLAYQSKPYSSNEEDMDPWVRSTLASI